VRVRQWPGQEGSVAIDARLGGPLMSIFVPAEPRLLSLLGVPRAPTPETELAEGDTQDAEVEVGPHPTLADSSRVTRAYPRASWRTQGPGRVRPGSCDPEPLSYRPRNVTRLL
jgi:hypothetical protein